MSPTYPGSAGGQPRLTLPFTRLNPNDPKFAEKFDAITRTLLTWANSLLLSTPSTGGVIDFGGWTATVSNNTHPNPVTWTPGISGGSFNYFDAGVQYIQGFPTSSFSIIQYGWSTGGAGYVPSTDASRIFLLLVGAASAAVSNAVDPDWLYNVGIIPSAVEDGRSGFLHVDSDNVGGTALPWNFDAIVTDVPGGMGMYLNIVSWSKP